MTRVTHLLDFNHENTHPRSRAFLYLDTIRTTLTNHDARETLHFGWLTYERERTVQSDTKTTVRHYRFGVAAGFWELIGDLSQKNTLLVVYCHDLDRALTLLDVDAQTQALGWRQIQYAQSDRVMYVTYRHQKRSISFVSTRNYWSGTLETLAESLGMSLPTVARATATMNDLEFAAEKHVDVLRAFMSALYTLAKDQQWGRFRSTLPAIAFGAFRHKYMADRPLIIADDKLSQFERSAYKGARTECFTVGEVKGLIYQLDVNSMYPAVMQAHDYPIRKVADGDYMDVPEYRRWRQRFLVIADVVIKTERRAYPVTLGDQLIWPVGEFQTTLATPELDRAVLAGDVREIGRYTLYTKAPLFERYVTDLYNLRLGFKRDGNRPLELVTKLMLNALYGKFGQVGKRWVPCQEPMPDAPTSYLYDCTGIGRPTRHIVRSGVILHEERSGESADSLPAVAAHITSYARLALWNLICQAGLENVHYVDTDSLFVNELGYDQLCHLIHPTRLGALKEVGKYDRATFRAPKDYSVDGIEVIKGIRSDACKLGEDTYEQDSVSGYASNLASGISGAVAVRLVTKHLRRDYRKGSVDANGRTLPFVLSR